MKSFLMIGQSNMAGRGFVQDVPSIYNEQIQMLRNGRWQMSAEPVNFDREVAGISLATSFAVAWWQEHQEEVGLIPCAEGGSTMDEWAIDGVLYRHAVSEAKFAMETSELTGILWHQGESDSYGGKHADYYQKLLAMFTQLRKDLDAPTLPIVIGGLGDYLGQTGFGLSCTEHEKINEELKRFAMTEENCYFVTAEGLTANPDGIHIDAVSQRKFGLRYFAAFNQKEHVMKPLENEADAVQIDAHRAKTNAEKMYNISHDFALGQIDYQGFIESFQKIQADTDK